MTVFPAKTVRVAAGTLDTIINWELIPDGSGTRLRLTHEGFNLVSALPTGIWGEPLSFPFRRSGRAIRDAQRCGGPWGGVFDAIDRRPALAGATSGQRILLGVREQFTTPGRGYEHRRTEWLFQTHHPGIEMSSGTAISVIAAMITPALLIVASASLVASALVRMARIVDRVRVLAASMQEGSRERAAASPDMVRSWLNRHEARARYVESSIALLYAAIVAFTATCLSIALDRAAGGAVAWLPVLLAIAGTLLLLAGGASLVAESRFSWEQIRDEIRQARTRLEEGAP